MRKDLSMAWGLVAAMMWGAIFAPQVLASGHDMDLYLTSLRWSSVNSEGNGKTARVSSETLVGPALGLRLHKHLNLITEVMFGNPDASVTPGPTNRADVMVVNVGLDGYIKHFDVSCGTLAPYLTGGLGTINLDQDSAGGFDEWPFSYNVGGGLRWDMGGNTFFKFYYRWLWANLKVTEQTELFHGYGVSFGFTF